MKNSMEKTEAATVQASLGLVRRIVSEKGRKN